MACSSVAPGVIVCRGRRLRRAKLCAVCHTETSSRLCDFVLPTRKTCDAPLCPDCARREGERDYCPHHPRVQLSLPLGGT